MYDIKSGEGLAGAWHTGDETHATLVTVSRIADHVGEQICGGVQITGIAVANLTYIVVLVQPLCCLNDRQGWPVRRLDPRQRVNVWRTRGMEIAIRSNQNGG